MRLEELPADVRRKVRRAIAAGAVRAATVPDVRPAVRGTALPPSAPSGSRSHTHRCDTCGRTFPTYPPAEAHVDRAHGHGRIAVLL